MRGPNGILTKAVSEERKSGTGLPHRIARRQDLRRPEGGDTGGLSGGWSDSIPERLVGRNAAIIAWRAQDYVLSLERGLAASGGEKNGPGR